MALEHHDLGNASKATIIKRCLNEIAFADADHGAESLAMIICRRRRYRGEAYALKASSIWRRVAASAAAGSWC